MKNLGVHGRSLGAELWRNDRRFKPSYQRARFHALSAPSAPTQQHTKTNTREHCSSQSLAVSNRNETGLLITDLNNAHRNGPHSSTASSTFAACASVANAARARPGSVAIHYLRDRNDRFPLRRDRFAVDGFYVRLAENALLQ